MAALLQQYEHLHVGVYGLGRTGLSVIQALIDSRAIPFAWDDNLDNREIVKKKFPQCYVTYPTEWDWSKITTVVLSPGIPLTFPEPHWIVQLANRDNNCSLKSDIQLFFENVNNWPRDANMPSSKIVCVTGTNGKSTTTCLISHILNTCGIDSEVGGNIGIPVFNLKPRRAAYILELSSFQLNLTSDFSVDAGVFLNLTPDHLDRHGNMENYKKVKEKLINCSKLAVIGYNSEVMRNIYQKLNKENKIPISSGTILENGVSILNNSLYERGKLIGFLNLNINVPGNSENIAAAYAICRSLFGLEETAILNAMKSFNGLPYRNQFVTKVRNITFVNDSKATNAASSEKTLLAWENIFWILGGQSKDEGIDPLVVESKKHFTKIKKVFLIGESTERFATKLEGVLEFDICENLEGAFEKSTLEALQKSTDVTILLSPACASFDQWKNFEERGKGFSKLVKEFQEKFVNE